MVDGWTLAPILRWVTIVRNCGWGRLHSSKEVIGRFGQFMGMSKRVLLRVYRRIEEIAGHPIESYSVSNVIRGTDAAVLVVHDREDLDVPVADAEAIAEANPAVDLQITNGLGHHRIARHADVIDRVIAGITR